MDSETKEVIKSEPSRHVSPQPEVPVSIIPGLSAVLQGHNAVSVNSAPQDTGIATAENQEAVQSAAAKVEEDNIKLVPSTTEDNRQTDFNRSVKYGKQ